MSHASENIGELFSTEADATLGLPLAEVVGPKSAQHLFRVIEDLAPGQIHNEVWEGRLARYSLCVHERGSRRILAWERLPELEAEQTSIEDVLSSGLLEISNAVHIHQQTELAAKLTSMLTGFGRVLVYRFHRDWSGEVIAEVRRSTAEPLLGHRYPASDIPAQARKLYLENLLRVLVDSSGKAISVLSLASELEPLDLTMSQLRAMSPYHLEYLRNTKVAATATASIICDGQLWGLLSCQHEQPRATAPSERSSVSQIARVLSLTIERTDSRAREVSQDRLRVKTEAMRRVVTEPDVALRTILFGPHRLRNMVSSCGTVVWTSTHGVLRMGETPSKSEIDNYAARLLSSDENLFAGDSRPDLETRLGALPENGALAGLMAVIVSRDPALILFWFRRENVRDITWGGDINQPVLHDELTGELSPRRSFALYKQSVTGTALEWTNENIATALMLRHLIAEIAPDCKQVAQLIESGFAFAVVLWPMTRLLITVSSTPSVMAHRCW